MIENDEMYKYINIFEPKDLQSLTPGWWILGPDNFSHLRVHFKVRNTNPMVDKL